MQTINALFATAVARFGERAALVEPAESTEMSVLSYHALQERARGFAGYLQQQKIAQGERIIIWSASRADWMAAYLGALLLGIVVVPLDVNTKEDFLERIAAVTEAKLLITTRKQFDGLKQSNVPFADIDALPQESLDEGNLPTVQPGDLAELVFTSGTTGQPKGVMLSHANITSNAVAALAVVRITADDKMLSILPLSHMFEMTIEIALLHSGGCCVYARSLVPDTLLRLLETQHITCMVLVPQALQLFLSGIEREVRRQNREQAFQMLQRVAGYLPFGWRRVLFASVHKRFGGHFHFFVSGGAYLPPKVARQWELMGFRVLQGYGATECSPVISVTPINDHFYESVGKPLPGVEVRIADDHEILVHGPNVALGYWQSPEATAASFKDGWYYTGDLGELDARGNLFLRGRKKNLIVLANGLNVYPEDVENVLHTFPQIKDAVVLGLTEDGGGPQVHAILLMDDHSAAKTVIQQANKLLAPQQQVRGFTIWSDGDFPRTHTLKVKRQDVLARLDTMRQQAKAEP